METEQRRLHCHFGRPLGDRYPLTPKRSRPGNWFFRGWNRKRRNRNSSRILAGFLRARSLARWLALAGMGCCWLVAGTIWGQFSFARSKHNLAAHRTTNIIGLPFHPYFIGALPHEGGRNHCSGQRLGSLLAKSRAISYLVRSFGCSHFVFSHFIPCRKTRDEL